LSAQKGKNQSNQTKLYQTKPIFRKSEMNLSPYIIGNYDDKLELLSIEKQSQNKPKQSQFYPSTVAWQPQKAG
jgi:hypothetical protein